MAIRSLKDFKQEVEGLRDGPLIHYCAIIKELGEYINQTRPSVVDVVYILQAEIMLHDIRRNFDDSAYRLSLKEDMIRPALGIASALNEIVNNNKRRDQLFYEDVTRLGELLLALATTISLDTA